jgi:hypothetical protein
MKAPGKPKRFAGKDYLAENDTPVENGIFVVLYSEKNISGQRRILATTLPYSKRKYILTSAHDAVALSPPRFPCSRFIILSAKAGRFFNPSTPGMSEYTCVA